MAPYDVNKDFVRQAFMWFQLRRCKEIVDKWKEEEKSLEKIERHQLTADSP